MNFEKFIFDLKSFFTARIRKPHKKTQIIAIGLAVILVFWVLFSLYVPIQPGFIPNSNAPREIDFEVKQGMSLSQVAADLKSQGLIRSRAVFILYVSASGADDSLKAGAYKLSTAYSAGQIADIIIGGFARSNDYQILLAEGFNVWEIDKRLSEYGMAEENYFSQKYIDSEGFLFPDTYRVARPSNDSFNLNFIADEVFNKMNKEFKDKTDEILAGLSEEKKRQVIIVASMLEKEARLKNDMKLVSGIIWKRLENDWTLSIDATVAYGACLREFETTKKICDVSQIGVGKEIKIDGPYNTYTRLGLPPGPIANPGLTAIEAALNPTESPYWYYLSARGTGQIIYSKTGEEHTTNRLKYLGL